jgi:hypothetical protein
MMAWKVSGLSQSPAIIASRPASMRLAMAISPSRERSSTEPISRRYMRTGSSVRSAGSDLISALAMGVTVATGRGGADSPSAPASGASSASSVSITLMPMSESIDMVSSICSEVTSSEGSTSFSSS